MDVTQKAPSVAANGAALRSQASPSHQPVARSTATSQGSFQQVFQRLASEVDRGERTVQNALRNAPDNETSGMIALQAGVYRYVEAVELCTKLVDRSTAAVKTTLQSQS